MASNATLSKEQTDIDKHFLAFKGKITPTVKGQLVRSNRSDQSVNFVNADPASRNLGFGTFHNREIYIGVFRLSNLP
jgi:hypothetical protein